jgi:hypothetical protein
MRFCLDGRTATDRGDGGLPLSSERHFTRDFDFPEGIV